MVSMFEIRNKNNISNSPFLYILQRPIRKGGIPSSSQNGPFNHNGEPDEFRQSPNMVPSTNSIYGIRRIDRKRRENRLMNFRMEEKKILDNILGTGDYDPRIRPVGLMNSTGNAKVVYYAEIVIISFILRKNNVGHDITIGVLHF